MKVNYIGIACLAVLLLTACDESKYELENLVPEEYHKVLYKHIPSAHKYVHQEQYNSPHSDVRPMQSEQLTAPVH